MAAPRVCGDSHWRSEGRAGRTGRHLLGAANGRKLFLKIHVKIQIVISYACAIKTKHYICTALLTSILMLLLTLRETYTFKRLSSFQNLRRKGGRFDHRPERPKFLLRDWRLTQLSVSSRAVRR